MAGLRYDPKKKEYTVIPETQTATNVNRNVVQGGVMQPIQPAAGTSPYKHGGSYWDNQYMTEDELKRIDSARQAAQRGEIPISQANTLAESIRAGYGYSGGKHGDEYKLLNQPVRTDSTEHLVSDVMQRMANYDQLLASDPYQPGLDAAYQVIRDRKPFEYDLETDPAWQAYRKQYTREGRRASEDTLGQYAAMTGGMPSTAAMTAAQQAGDYYAAQMTDKIPELYRLAYSMYADDANRQLADLNAIRGLSGDWYGRQQDAYGRLGDLYSMASSERSYADAQAQQAAEDAYKYAMATGDYSYLKQLGYDTSYLEKQRDKDMAELDKPLLSLSEVNAAIKAGNTAPNVLKAWEYYYGAPYSGQIGGTGGYGYGGGDDGNGADGANANPLAGFGLPAGKWKEIISAAQGDQDKAMENLSYYWDVLTDEQRSILAQHAGFQSADLNRLGGVSEIGLDTLLNYKDFYDNAPGAGDQSGKTITYNDPEGQYMVDMTNNNPAKAEEYYMANWDNLDYYMRFRLLQNAGVDDETARQLAAG